MKSPGGCGSNNISISTSFDAVPCVFGDLNEDKGSGEATVFAQATTEFETEAQTAEKHEQTKVLVINID